MRLDIRIVQVVVAVLFVLVSGCSLRSPDRDWRNINTDYVAELLQPDLDKLAKHRFMSSKEANEAARCEADVLLQSEMSDDGVDLFAMGYNSIPGGLRLAVDGLTTEDFAAFHRVAGEFVGCLYDPESAPKVCGDRCAEPVLPTLKRSLEISWSTGSRSQFKDTDLTGTWRVVSILGADGKLELVESPEGVWISFDDGEYGARTVCNSVGGKYTQDGADIGISEVGSTLVGCREVPLAERLMDVRHVSGAGDKRVLHSDTDRGNVLIELRRYRPEGKGPHPPTNSMWD